MRGLCEPAVSRDTLILWTLSRSGSGGDKEESLGKRTWAHLLQAAGSPEALWSASGSFLEAHLTPARRQRFEQIQSTGLPDTLPEVYARSGVRVIGLTDPAYPPLLRETYAPPLVLYVQGDPAAMTGKTLAVVGTRRVSEYGRKVADKLIADLSPARPCIVSGLAAGIDTCAHRAALAHQLPTVAVFGCGLDVIFPKENDALSREIVAAGGTLVSEYPLGTPPSKFTFPQRNRIVAGMSYGTLVVEGDVRSGALITARLALEEGRSVYAVPGNIFNFNSAGPHHLIKTGAVPVTEGADILKDLNWLGAESRQLTLSGTEAAVSASPQNPPPLPDSLSEEERRILALIPFDPVAVDAITLQSGLPQAVISEHLTMLELDGWIESLPGARVCRK